MDFTDPDNILNQAVAIIADYEELKFREDYEAKEREANKSKKRLTVGEIFDSFVKSSPIELNQRDFRISDVFWSDSGCD